MLLFVGYYFINSLNIYQTLAHASGNVSFDTMRIIVNRCKFIPVEAMCSGGGKKEQVNMRNV